MLWEIIVFTCFLYCSGYKIIPICSSDCTTEKVLGYDVDDFAFQGKYRLIVLVSNEHRILYFTAACEGHLVKLEFLPDKEVGPL